MVLQRKVVLYGPRVRESPEERVEKDLRRELRAALPQLYGGMLPSWKKRTSAKPRLLQVTILSSGRT